MIIRGIDFARHTVVVGNTDTEALAPASNAQALPGARGDVIARVISVSGGEATLDIAGMRVVVQAHVALTAGDKLMVRIQEPKNGTLKLTILSGGPQGDGLRPGVADSDLDALLMDLGMPVDERTRTAARALVSRDGTLEKEPLKALLADLRGFRPLSPREAGAAALLQKAGVAVDEDSLALIAARAEPDAPPQLPERLAPLAPALAGLLRQLPARSPVTQQIQDVLKTLEGLPLDEHTTNDKVAGALRAWLGKLQPANAVAPELRAAGPVARPLAGAAPGGASKPGDADMATTATAASEGVPGAESPLEAEATELPQGGAPAPTARAGLPGSAPAGSAAPADQATSAREGGAKPAAARAEPVLTSQRVLAGAGITKGGPIDLASQLKGLLVALGADHPEASRLLKSAEAELRYTQLVNGPAAADAAAPPQGTPSGAHLQEFLVPLLLPQLSPDHPEGRIQVFQRAARRGEPIDPDNVRFVFVLETEHMATVQADLTIKDGQVDLMVGVKGDEDRSLMAKHLGELEDAIAGLGFPTGRFAARQAKGLPPRVRQEEGIRPVVRFDRKV